MSKEQIQQKINKNREEINNLLHKDVPLDFLYMRVNMLTAQNESLINRLKTV